MLGRVVTEGAARRAVMIAGCWLVACTVDDRNPGTQMNTFAEQPSGGAEAATTPTTAAAGADGGRTSESAPTVNPDGLPPVAPAAPAPAAEGTRSGVAVMPPVDPTGAGLSVSGRVVDFFRHGLANVAVTIGATTATTDSNGQFSISGVRAPYDVSFTLSYQHNNAPAQYGYVYQGLTRTDPTLQTYGGMPEHGGSVTAVLQNADFSDLRRSAIFAFGSEFGGFSTELDVENTMFGASWVGPATLTGTAHLLLVSRSDTRGFGLPVAYEAQQSSPLGMQDGVTTAALFDLSPNPISAATLAGTVSGGDSSDRANLVSVRFADGTVLPIINDAPDSPLSFSYSVPALPQGSLSVAAASGVLAPFALVHVENVAAGAAPLALRIPAPVNLGAPAAGTLVTPATAFGWSSTDATLHTFLWHLETADTLHGIYVLTTRTQVTLPSFADGFFLPADTDISWSVETHGNPADVNVATGPNGFLDAFALRDNFPQGPTPASGTFTESERRTIRASR